MKEKEVEPELTNDIETNKSENIVENEPIVEVVDDPIIEECQEVNIEEKELQALIEKANKLDELQDNFVRQIADFENAKKRLEREKEEFAKFANEKIIAAFLPVLDNLERALSHSAADQDDDNKEGLASGVTLIKKQILDILVSNGLAKIEAAGKEFDPHFHEAMGTIPTSEHPVDSVVEEIQAGYMLKDKLIRPSWVRVAVEIENSEQ